MPDYNFKPKTASSRQGWHNRGYLPHFDGGETAQFITFRLFDSMPQDVLEKWRNDAKSDAEFRKRVEGYLDAGYGECWLQDHKIAQIVQDALFFQAGKTCKLIAWVIMPNHVHILIIPNAGHELSDILHSIKSFTAHEANKLLGRTGQFWQHESFDRYIRNYKHYANVINYIENNPVKVGLCKTPSEWKFSSANK
jgi:REP element-mobilizing transposase RayT